MNRLPGYFSVETTENPTVSNEFSGSSDFVDSPADNTKKSGKLRDNASS